MAESQSTQHASITDEYSPLHEAAVKADGTIGLKLIQPGWGSSGYYSPDVLERDIPSAFPIGSHMYWNHPTTAEETERPEGDLSRLAAVLVSEPYFNESGDAGPGVYADAKVFSPYAQAIDEMAPHIGVSIRGRGRQDQGEAEGQEGPIVTEITQGMSVDFVTKPGAGGQIIEVFESVPNAEALPDIVELKEASNLGEWLESIIHREFTITADGLFGDGILNREERIAASSAIGDALGAFRDSLMAAMPGLYSRPAYTNAEPSADLASESIGVETMADNELNEAQDALAEAQSTISEHEATIAKMQELALMREAHVFVHAALAEADLPEMTQKRLARELAKNPNVEDGKLDEDAYTARIDDAVKEAQAEIAAVTGSNGQITGQGSAPATDGPTLEESQKQQDELLAALGLGGK